VRIELRMFMSFTKYLPPGEEGISRFLEVSPESTVHEVLSELGVPRESIMVIFVNGGKADLDRRLAEGDVISVMSPAGGG